MKSQNNEENTHNNSSRKNNNTMKKIKPILLLFAFIFMKILSYSMFILTGAILIKQMPNPEPLHFLFSVFCAFGVDFGASLVDEEWKKSMIESYDHN